MKNRTFVLLFFPGLALLSLLCACAPSASPRAVDLTLRDQWRIQSSAQVAAEETLVSTAAFNPEGWYTTNVPRTVLAALVDAGEYGDIYFDRNLEKIPGERFDVPWWYRREFTLPRLDPETVVRLRFDGINYRAEVWVNGHQVASSDSVKGGFRRPTFDVTGVIRPGNEALAVKVSRPQAGDPTLGFVDWNPRPPDHNMGLWRDVDLLVTGPVSVDLPFVQSRLDTTLDHADLTVSAVLQNYSEREVNGMLSGTIGDEISFSQPVTLAAHESREVAFSPEQFPVLALDHPRLWWVHTLGKPNLYDLYLEFSSGGLVFDSRRTRFGIRSVSDYLTEEEFGGYRLNGKKILIKGGGWTDPMLLNASPEYERAGIDYAVHMNLNAIRMEGFWGQNEHLYDLCDERGLLIMIGWSAQWEWEDYFGTEVDEFGGIKTPEQMDVAAQSFRDQVLWLRNHPSIMAWMYGSDKLPRPALEKEYLKILEAHDPSRPVAAAAAERTSEVTGLPTGMKMRGPYDYVPPAYWYMNEKEGGAFGFNTETGPGPQIPPLESWKKMIPAESLWPIGDSWLYHAARNEFHNFNFYNRAMNNRLGPPQSLEDYLRKAQYLNYEGMRAMFEAFQANRDRATGIIQWMFNSSWPKLWWQLYDYYLLPNGAFYGARKANEPLHISYNYGRNGVDVINNTLEVVKGLKAEIRVLNFDLSGGFEKMVDLPALADQGTLQTFDLPDRAALSHTYFLKLTLRDNSGNAASNNFYVLSSRNDRLDQSRTTWFVTPQSQFADLTMLEELSQVKLEVRKTFETRGESTFAHVTLKNSSSHLAFMVHLNFLKSRSRKSVAPIFWEDNYITLLPGEERSLTGTCYTRDLEGEMPEVTVEGWNVR